MHNMISYPIQPGRAPEYWLYSNGNDGAWCASKRDFLKMFPPGNHGLVYRAAHDGEGIPPGFEATRGTGLADDSIRRKRNAMKSLIAALSP